MRTSRACGASTVLEPVRCASYVYSPWIAVVMTTVVAGFRQNRNIARLDRAHTRGPARGPRGEFRGGSRGTGED
jgi:hypothetical protein